MFGKDDPPSLETVESYIDCCAGLKVESIDFLAGRGWASTSRTTCWRSR